MKLKRILIVGLGLMGGSLAAACRKRFPDAEISAVTRSRRALSYAKRKGWIHDGYTVLGKAVKGADLIVLCTPVDSIYTLLEQIDRLASAGVCVTDVGSVKGELQTKVNKKRWKNLVFIGSHPMVGSHEQGIEAARPDLYDQGLVFVVEDPAAPQKARRLIKSFWKGFTRRVVEMRAEEHDLIVSEISHLPHAVACCLMLAVSPRSLRYAAAGFRSTTRVAASPTSVWRPIFSANQKALLPVMQRFERTFREFRRAVSSGDTEALWNLLEDASLRRKEI